MYLAADYGLGHVVALCLDCWTVGWIAYRHRHDPKDPSHHVQCLSADRSLCARNKEKNKKWTQINWCARRRKWNEDVCVIYLGCTRSTSGVVFGKMSGLGTGRRCGSGVVVCVCVSDDFVLPSKATTGSRSSRFKRFKTFLMSGTSVSKLPCIALTVSLIWSAVFVTCSGSPFW